MKHFIAFCRRNRLFAALLAAELAVVCALAAGLFGAPYKLALAPGAAGVVETRLADGLYVRRERAECGNVLFVCVPRVDAGGAELDAPACRAVGVYVDELGSHCDKSTNFK
mgnify:CR=1 FL=1